MCSFVRLRRLAAPLVLGPLGLAFVTPLDAQEGAPADEMVVTGVPRDRAPGQLAQSVTVVGGEALERVRAATLGETPAGRLGVSSSGFTGGASRPIIRGPFAGARVQMLEDGIATTDAATIGGDHAVTVEPLAAEQVEIFRGPTTLLYGSGAAVRLDGGRSIFVSAALFGSTPNASPAASAAAARPSGTPRRTTSLRSRQRRPGMRWSTRTCVGASRARPARGPSST